MKNPKAPDLLKNIKYEHLLAGVTGGVTSTLILHPLDLLKIRFAGEKIGTPAKFGTWPIRYQIIAKYKMSFLECPSIPSSIGTVNLYPSLYFSL
jgi:Mitochondrial carrier protein.